MKEIFKLLVVVFILTFISCNNQNLNQPIAEQEDLIFPIGEKITNTNFVGTAWLIRLLESDSTNQIAVGNVTFEPGARSNWHVHPNGQILISLGGVGYYQKQGSPIVIIQKGDVVNIPPNVLHWHGASVDQKFIQLAITSRQEGPTQWFQAVTEEEYLGQK